MAAVGFHPLQHVVNVHWGGAVFIVITIKGDAYRVNSRDASLQAVSFPIADIYSLVGCEFATVDDTPTFVIAGSELVHIGGGGSSAGFICTSNDGGRTWARSFQTPQGVDPVFHSPWAGTASAIVYHADSDSRVFAASCLVFRPAMSEEIYTSSDGREWHMSSSHDIISVEETRSNASTFPADFCAHNADCIDDLGHSVPGGIMYDDLKTQMRPSKPPAVYYWANAIPGNIDYHTLPLQTFGGFAEPIGSQPSPNVKITRREPEGDSVTDVIIPGLAITTCVAGKDSIWLAGGFTSTAEDSGGAVVITRDNGETWESIGSTSSGVVGIAFSAATNADL